MAKPRIYGSNAAYIPNARADMRFSKKLYQRGLEHTNKHEAVVQEIRKRREMKQMEEMKERKCLPHELED